MAHTLDLTAEARTVVGKKVKHLRREGKVPANLYGHGVDSTPIQVDAKALADTLRHSTATTLINLRIGEHSRPRPVFVRDVRWALMRHEAQHVDFFAVRMDEKMRATVQLVFRGESPAARSTELMLIHPLTSVQVEGLPGDLPESIPVDVSHLEEVDQSIHVRDLSLPEGVTVLADLDELIVKVTMTRAALEPVATEDTAEAAGEAAAEEAPTVEAEPAS